MTAQSPDIDVGNIEFGGPYDQGEEYLASPLGLVEQGGELRSDGELRIILEPVELALRGSEHAVVHGTTSAGIVACVVLAAEAGATAAFAGITALTVLGLAYLARRR